MTFARRAGQYATVLCAYKNNNRDTVSSFDNFMVRDHMSVWLNDTDD